MASTPKIIDQWGNPVSSALLKKEQAAPTSASVRRHDALHPAAGLTPGRLARVLRESIDGDPESYLALAEDMEERDLHYAGVLAVRKRQVAGLNITVEGPDDSWQSQKDAQVVREVIARDGFEDELIDILDAIGKGFSATEICWETSEGQWRPKALKWRDPRWFTFDQVDGETLMLRGDGGQPEPLHPYKWIVHTAKAKSGLPIRGGLARVVAWSFLFKAFTVKDWAIFCEAYGQPLRLGKWGEGATEEDKQKLLEAVTAIGTDYAAIVPQSMAIEFIKAEISGSHQLYKERADWLDQQVSKVVLGQTATTDAIAGGHAVGRTHDRVREDIERADARQLAATLNRDLVRPIVDLNHGAPGRRGYPRIVIGRPEEEDVDKLVSNVVRLVPLGLKVGMSTMRDKLGLPDPAKGEELLASPRARQEPPAPTPPATAAMAAGRAADRDAIDRGVDELMDDWEPLVAPIVDGLADAIAGAKSLAEVEALLADRFRDMDVDELRTRLARAAFAARVSGEAGEDL